MTFEVLPERLARLVAERSARAHRQWVSMGPLLRPMVLEEARVLGRDLDQLVAPVTLHVEQRAAAVAAACWDLIGQAIAASASRTARYL